jgi:archaellin
VVAGPDFLDNGAIRVEVEPNTGDIRRLASAGAGASRKSQIVGAGGGFGAYLYVAGRDPSKAERAGRPTIEQVSTGPLVATLRITSAAPGTERLVRTVTLVAGSDRIDVETALLKTSVRTKESAHVAFPLDLPGATIRVDQGEALVAIEADQLPGACKDFIGAPGALDVSNDKAGVAIASADAPIFELGAITDERSEAGLPRMWRTVAAPGTTIYAYLLNNYWHTNYKADQAGPLVFRFTIQPHGRFDAAGLRRFGAEVEQPLVAWPSAPGVPLPRPAFAFDSPSIVVSSLRPEGAGSSLIVRLYNASWTEAVARLGDESVRLPPFGTRTIRVPSAVEPSNDGAFTAEPKVRDGRCTAPSKTSGSP